MYSGNYIEITHANGCKTVYKHLKLGSIKVALGAFVAKGQEIAYMGKTGYSTGNHTHFEVILNGQYQDPTPYLKGEKLINAPAPTPTPNPAPATPKYTGKANVGDIINFKGNTHYGDSYTNTGKAYKPGQAKITSVNEKGNHPYHVIHTGEDSNVYCWVDAGTLTKI